MSESREDFSFNETGDFSCSSFISNITGLNDEDTAGPSPSAGPSTSAVNISESSCSLERHVSSKNNSSASWPSLSSITSKITTETLEGASKAKVAEYKEILEQVNTAYANYKISEFLVGCAKESQKKMKPQLRARVQSVMTNSAAQKYSKLKSASGKSYNILGLTDEVITRVAETKLNPNDKVEFKNQMLETVKHKVEELKKQKQLLLAEDGILMGARKKHQELLQVIPKQVETALGIMCEMSETILQLEKVKEGNRSELLEQSYNLICQKAEFLSTFISELKLRLDSKMYGDNEYKRALNEYGNKIKAHIDETRIQLDEMASVLAEYEGKENSSQIYKTLIEDYAKVKRELQHCCITLSILSDDGSSACSSNKPK